MKVRRVSAALFYRRPPAVPAKVESPRDQTRRVLPGCARSST